MAVDSGATTNNGGEATVRPPTNLPAHCALKEVSKTTGKQLVESGQVVETLQNVTLISKSWGWECLIHSTLHSLPNRIVQDGCNSQGTLPALTIAQLPQIPPRKTESKQTLSLISTITAHFWHTWGEVTEIWQSNTAMSSLIRPDSGEKTACLPKLRQIDNECCKN